MWKTQCEKITLNVKNDRSGKCEKNLNAKMWKVVGPVNVKKNLR